MFRNSRNITPNISEVTGENNNMYYYTPNLGSQLIGPAARGPSAAEDSSFSLLNSASNSGDVAAAARLAASPSDSSPLMSNMIMAGDGGEPEISEFRMRAVMIFTYVGFAFLTIVLLGTFILSTYWTLSGSCKSKQKGQQGKGGEKKVQMKMSGGCCSIDDVIPPPPVSSSSASTSSSINFNGSQKKSQRKSPPKSFKYNETAGRIDDEESELLEWDRQTQVIEMEDL